MFWMFLILFSLDTFHRTQSFLFLIVSKSLEANNFINVYSFKRHLLFIIKTFIFRRKKRKSLTWSNNWQTLNQNLYSDTHARTHSYIIRKMWERKRTQNDFPQTAVCAAKDRWMSGVKEMFVRDNVFVSRDAVLAIWRNLEREIFEPVSYNESPFLKLPHLT
jgi:hypothetical protein